MLCDLNNIPLQVFLDQGWVFLLTGGSQWVLDFLSGAKVAAAIGSVLVNHIIGKKIDVKMCRSHVLKCPLKNKMCS